MTGAQAWNRLFDETMASLKFEVDGEELGLEGDAAPALGSRRDEARGGVPRPFDKTLHDNERLFTHITNVLAKDKEISDRWRGYKDIADSRHLANSVEREVVDALEKAVTRGLSAAQPPLLRDEGQMVRQGPAQRLGPQRAAAHQRRAGLRLGDRPRPR